MSFIKYIGLLILNVFIFSITEHTEAHFSDISLNVQLPDQVVYWSHWLKYLAWVLCTTTSFTAGFFTLLYGLSFGRVGQEEWLFSLFCSVFCDVIFNQPIKVRFLSICIALINVLTLPQKNLILRGGQRTIAVVRHRLRNQMKLSRP